MKKVLIVVASLVIGQSAVAKDFLTGFSLSEKPTNKKVIQAKPSSNYLSFKVDGQLHQGTVTISGPNGYYLTKRFKESANSVRLNEFSNLPAGRYFYEITAHVGSLKLVRDTIDNGRGENNFTYAGTPVMESGSFVVESGSVKTFNQVKEEPYSGW